MIGSSTTQSPFLGMTGVIRINSEIFKRDIQAVVASAKQGGKQIETALNNSAAGTSKALNRVVADAKKIPTPFNQLSKAVGEARIALLSFTAAAGGLITFGIHAADSIQILTTRYRELGKSEAEGARLMNQIAESARKVNLPIRQAQKDFLGLIPAVREAGGSLEEYTNIALRLATLNTDSRGGVEGAIYAIREALSSGGSDLVSLAERFNIPRRALRETIKETGSLSAALDIILDKYGATTAAVAAQSRSVGTLLATIRDTATQLLERTFGGILERVRDVLISINNFLKSIPQPLVDIAAGLVIAAGAASAFALAVSGIGVAYTNLMAVGTRLVAFFKLQWIPTLIESGKAAALASSSNATLGGLGSLSAIGKLGLTGAALGVGAAGGFAATRLIGDVTGNERLKNYGLEDAFETFKHIIFLAAYGILEVAKLITKSIVGVVSIFGLLGKTLELFGAEFKVLLLTLGIGLNNLLNNTAESQRLQKELGGTSNTYLVDDAGIKVLDVMTNSYRRLDEAETAAFKTAIDLGNYSTELLNQTTGLTRIKTNEGGAIEDVRRIKNEIKSGLAAPQQATDEFFANLERGFRDLLFPVQSDLADAKEAAKSLFEEIQTGLNNVIYAQREAFGNNLAKNFDSTVAFVSELADLIDNGDKDAVEGRIKALERERDAIKQLLPELEQYADDSQEAADKLAEANSRLNEINSMLPQFIDALTAATQRALAKAQDEYTKAIADAAEKRDAALLKIATETAEQMTSLKEDVADKLKDLQGQEAKIQADFNKAAIKAEEEYRRRLQEIQRNYNRAVILAASQLDAAGVAAAINQRKEDLRKAREQRDDALRGNQERANEQRAALKAELDDLMAYYEKRRQEIFAQNVKETAEAQAIYDNAFAIAQTARDNERNALMAYYDQRYQDLTAALELERQVRNVAMTQMLADMIKSVFTTIPATIASNLGIGGANPAGVGSTLLQGLLGAISVPFKGAGGLLAAAGATSSVSPTININGVIDPIGVGEVVRQVIVDLGRG